MTESADAVRYVLNGPVATITLNRPDRLNALDPAMLTEIPRLLARAANDGARDPDHRAQHGR